ncbi:MAG: N-6 DNA methylase, partial [Candidatus Sericytochromatia bacterium]
MQNFSEKINMIWQIAESLRNVYRPEKYGDVILPLAVMRRFDCILEESKDKVLNKYEQVKTLPQDAIDITLKKESGNPLYNISKYTFKKLLNDSENIGANLRNYINGFSKNARDILEHFNFEEQIKKLDKSNALYNVMKEFTNVDFHPEVVSNIEMGYLFEELIRKFKENAEAGDHYTPREVIRLCVSLMLGESNENFAQDGLITTFADFACGTGGMLSEGEKYIKELNENVSVELFGQEINEESYAICKSDMLIKGQNSDNIVFGNSLTEDGHKGKTYRYLISNPPFGVQWKNEENFVKQEHETAGFNGRFGAGTPRVSDGSLLFLLNMIDKMKKDEKGSRISIIFNGSPLFTGDAGSGESNIRKWIIENDLLEGIIA